MSPIPRNVGVHYSHTRVDQFQYTLKIVHVYMVPDLDKLSFTLRHMYYSLSYLYLFLISYWFIVESGSEGGKVEQLNSASELEHTSEMEQLRNEVKILKQKQLSENNW